jgi:hypothetical protein
MTSIYHLSLKAQKVQSFIFKVPKLKAMLGANSLLGEYFAVELPALREKYSIPEIWIERLTNLKNLGKWENDDLAANFQKGVICSAGGHFEAFFKSMAEAEEFVIDAIKMGQSRIPGVKLSYYLREYKNFDINWSFEDFANSQNYTLKDVDIQSSEMLIDNPYFYPSAVDGENPQLLNKEKDSYITKKIKEQGDYFYSGEANDYLCGLIKELAGKESYKSEYAEELEELSELSLIPDNNKLAIIAIDGNAMGINFRQEQSNQHDKPVLEAMVEFEKFWFDKRDSFRMALREALQETVNLMNYKKHPYQILMLGGDDLLILTVPELALDFVSSFCKKISEKGQVTISAGIAFVKYSYPFSQAYQLAEQLLDSAKVKSRIWHTDGKIEYQNAIDWQVHFPSGARDLDELRRQDYLLKYGDKLEILTQRPCTITKALDIWKESEGLFTKIQKAAEGEDFENSSGRNKYKRLRTLLKTGENNVKLYGGLLNIDQSYLDYESLDDGIVMNSALDVIELMDFHKRKNERQRGGNNEIN